MSSQDLESIIIGLGASSYTAWYGIIVHTADRKDDLGNPFGVPEAIEAIRKEQSGARIACKEIERLRALVYDLETHIRNSTNCTEVS